jgi:hypothetical protein
MADGAAGRCEPYRVEWRASLSTNWSLFDRFATLGEAEAKAARVVNQGGGQARVVEQRVVLVRGLGQDGGPDQAFMDWQQMQPPPFRAEMRHWRDEPCDCMNPFLVRPMARPDGGRGCGYCRGRLGSAPPVVSDPDDRRDVEAAADAGQPMTPFSANGWTRFEFAAAKPFEAPMRFGVYRTAQTKDMSNVAVYRVDFSTVHPETWHVLGSIQDAEQSDIPAEVGDRVLLADHEHNRCWAWVAAVDGDLLQFALDESTWQPGDAERGSLASVTDTQGCAHRMSSGAVSLTACGECGAEPGDDCADAVTFMADVRQWAAGAPSCAFRMEPRATQDGRPSRPLWSDVQCRECGAQPGEPCADPLEDRIAWRVKQATAAREVAGTPHVERYWQRLTEDHGRRAAHENLDLTGVPRHLATDGEQPSDEDIEAERVLDATAAKIGGTSPLESAMRETTATVENLLAEHGMTHGTGPWWRRLLQRTKGHR